jgi:protein subunit release factor A
MGEMPPEKILTFAACPNIMIDKLEGIRDRFREVGEWLTQPDAMADMKRFSQMSKEYKELEKIMAVYSEYENVCGELQDQCPCRYRSSLEGLRSQSVGACKIQIDTQWSNLQNHIQHIHLAVC